MVTHGSSLTLNAHPIAILLTSTTIADIFYYRNLDKAKFGMGRDHGAVKVISDINPSRG